MLLENKNAVICGAGGVAVKTSTGRASMADTEASEVHDRTKEIPMRKVVAVKIVSLDGVMESPGKWA